MRRRIVGGVLAAVTVVAGLAIVPAVLAHECLDQNGDGRFDDWECQPSKVWGGWRPNWVPLFDYPDRDDRTGADGRPADQDERRTYQRWRDEYGCYDQMCIWILPNWSFTDGSPRSIHAGVAADHSLAEGFHESEDHGPSEDNHDTHGGTIYADVCLAEDTHYTGTRRDIGCKDMEDTEIGIVVVDHLDCTFGCQDEYQIIRPLDMAFTMAQIDRIPGGLQWRLENPDIWLCGYPGYGSNCPLR